MTKTKIKKVLAVLAMAAMASTQITHVLAATQIGTGSIQGGGTTPIIWDDNFPGSASGSLGIVVNARVAPTLTLTISTGAIDLGTLSSAATSTGTIQLEIGTNAKDGVSVTARSSSGGLTNTADNSVQINDLTTDGVAESYKFTSALNAATDSTIGSFTGSAALSTEVNENTTEHVVYTTNKPEATNGINDVDFSVSALIDAQTQAGDYQDTITFTVTGNF